MGTTPGVHTAVSQLQTGQTSKKRDAEPEPRTALAKAWTLLSGKDGWRRGHLWAPCRAGAPERVEAEAVVDTGGAQLTVFVADRRGRNVESELRSRGPRPAGVASSQPPADSLCCQCHHHHLEHKNGSATACRWTTSLRRQDGLSRSSPFRGANENVRSQLVEPSGKD